MSNGILCEDFEKYEVTRNRIFCRLLDPRWQEDGCRDVLSRPWMDLRLCVYYDLEEDGFPGAAVTIYKNCLSLWHVPAEKVLEDAWRNTTERRILFRPLESVLHDMQEGAEWPDVPEERSGPPVYVLTNIHKANGAVYMAAPDVLRRIGKRLGKDFYILPSSIHECLILPDTGEEDEEMLNALVSMVNLEYLDEKDVLTDHVYYYDRLLQQVHSC